MPTNQHLVVVATFSLPSEAAVAASVLDGEGIDSLIDKPFVSGVRPDWIFGTERRDDGVRLLVRHDDVERARDVLASLNHEDDTGGDPEGDEAGGRKT